MRHAIRIYTPALVFVAAWCVLFVWQAPIAYLAVLMEGSGILSYAAFVGLLISATICAPVTVMPLIPVAAVLFGPFTTGVLSVVGWTLGAVGAFIVARYWGRPVVGRFISLDSVDRLAARIPENAQFMGIVALRLALPVDIVSYAIGLISNIGLMRYTIATALGVTWFSFAFAYLGDAVFRGDTRMLVVVGGLSVLVFGAGWYMLVRRPTKDV